MIGVLISSLCSYGNSLTRVVRQTVKEGALFRGLSAPLLGAFPLNAYVFVSNGFATRVLDDHFSHLSRYHRVFWAGAVAGALQSAFASPIELAKCMMQTDSMHESKSAATAPRRFTGVVDCCSSLWRAGGPISLFRGLWTTILRDVPSFGCYFLTYDYIKDRLATLPMFAPSTNIPSSPSTHPQPFSVLLIAGGVSGVLSWAISYPFDVVKTAIQTAPPEATYSELRLTNITRKMYAEGGSAIFWRGFTPCIIRAFPVNAVILASFDLIMHSFRELGL